MSKYELLNNLPIPVTPRGGKPRHDFPFADMKVGDAFIENIDPAAGEEKGVERLKAAVGRWKKATGNKTHRFTVAVIDHPDEMVGGRVIGVWRAADAAAKADAAAQ